MSEIGTLNATITADASSFMNGVKKATGGTAELRKKFNAGVKSAAKYTAALGATGAAITAGLVRSGLNAVDSQAKLARSLGGSTAAVQALIRAGDRAGVSQGALSSAAEKLNQRLGEAANKGGLAADTLKTLGLDAAKLSNMDVDERMATLSDAMVQGGLSSQEMAFHLRNLGIRQGEVVNLIQGGGQAIRDSRKMVEAFGVAVTEVEAGKIEQANDAMADIGNVIQGVSNQMAIEFAPILEGLSKRITELAQESRGFTDAISSGMDSAVKATSFIIDSIESVRRIFVSAGKLVSVTVLQLISDFKNLASQIISGPVAAINKMIEVANNIPGINIPQVDVPAFAEKMRVESAQAREAVSMGMQDIKDTLLAPLPGQSIRNFVNDVKASSQEASQQVVNDRIKQNEQIKALTGESNNLEIQKNMELMQKKKEQRLANIENIRQSMMTERELQLVNNEKKLEQLKAARESELITEQEFNDLKEGLSKKHQDKLNQIEKQGLNAREKFQKSSMSQQVGTVAGEMERMTAGVAKENKAMFAINKTAGIANAIVSAYEGFNKSLGAYPQPLAGAIAAGHLASGLAAVNKIKGQSFNSSGGGGSVPSRSTSTPTTTQGQGQAQQPQTVNRNINLSGDGITQQFIRELVPELNESLGDGVNLRAR